VKSNTNFDLSFLDVSGDLYLLLVSMLCAIPSCSVRLGPKEETLLQKNVLYPPKQIIKSVTTHSLFSSLSLSFIPSFSFSPSFFSLANFAEASWYVAFYWWKCLCLQAKASEKLILSVINFEGMEWCRQHSQVTLGVNLPQ
jgi:hypothetical protein